MPGILSFILMLICGGAYEKGQAGVLPLLLSAAVFFSILYTYIRREEKRHADKHKTDIYQGIFHTHAGRKRRH